MRQIKLNLTPYKICVLPSGGWLVYAYPSKTLYRPFKSTFLMVNFNGDIKNVGRGVLHFSKKRNEFLIYSAHENNAFVWSESGKVDKLDGFIFSDNSSNYSNGIAVCTNFDLKKPVENFEQIKGLHRKSPVYYHEMNFSLALMPQFTYNAIKEGERHKNTIFFLKVDTGEHRSIEAVGMKKVKLAYPSYDGLTAIAVDGDGNGLIIDNPF